MTYPGANFLNTKIRETDKVHQRICLQYCKQKLKLKLGDVLERHLMDGDIVLFNRQPTLHKPSMMAHKIVVTESDTF